MLIGFIILLSLWIVYQDWRYRGDLRRKDEFIKDLELKFMSKGVDEYSRFAGEPPADMEDKSEEFIDADEIDPDKALRAKDSL